jgi:hypothetical protein
MANCRFLRVARCPCTEICSSSTTTSLIRMSYHLENHPFHESETVRLGLTLISYEMSCLSGLGACVIATEYYLRLIVRFWHDVISGLWQCQNAGTMMLTACLQFRTVYISRLDIRRVKYSAAMTCTQVGCTERPSLSVSLERAGFLCFCLRPATLFDL